MIPGLKSEPIEQENGNVRRSTGYRAEEPVSDGGGGRQVVLVVRLWQERQSAVLRWLAQGQRFHAGRVQGGGGRHDFVLWLQEHRQQAALRRNAPESVAPHLSFPRKREPRATANTPGSPLSRG